MTNEVTADLKSIVDDIKERKQSDEEALFVAKVELEILTQQQQAKRQEVKQIEERVKASDKQLKRVAGFLDGSGTTGGSASAPSRRRGRKASAKKAPGKRGRPRKATTKAAGAKKTSIKKAAAKKSAAKAGRPRKAATGVGRGRGRRRTGGPPTQDLVLQVLGGAPAGLVTKDVVSGVNKIDASRTYSNITAQVSNLKKAGRVVQDGDGRYKLAS